MAETITQQLNSELRNLAVYGETTVGWDIFALPNETLDSDGNFCSESERLDFAAPDLYSPSHRVYDGRHAKHPLPLDTPFPSSKIIIQPHRDGESSEVIVETDRDLFTYEADMVANHIEARQAPAMSWDDTLGNMRLLDSWREEVGVVY